MNITASDMIHGPRLRRVIKFVNDELARRAEDVRDENEDGQPVFYWLFRTPLAKEVDSMPFAEYDRRLSFLDLLAESFHNTDDQRGYMVRETGFNPVAEGWAVEFAA